MTKIFDKVTGTSTAFESDGITDSNAVWVENYYTDWYCVIDGTQYKITGNTTTKLYFSNALAENKAYSIEFVVRDFLKEIESDAENAVKISDDFISKKYNQVNIDLHNKVYAYLKQSIGDGVYNDYPYIFAPDSTFDPMENILNLTCLQQSFAYLLLAKIYQDLSIDQESFETFKGYNMHQKSYNDGVKDALAMLQLDLDQDGSASDYEKKHTVSSTAYLTR